MGLMSSLLFWRRKSPIVPVVRLSGVIAARQSLGRRGLSLEAVEPQLKRAFSDKRAKAVVLPSIRRADRQYNRRKLAIASASSQHRPTYR